MFTGLIEEVGEILNITSGISSGKITIKAKKVLEDIKLGDSIAVNGICLTATFFESDSFTVDVMAETMRKTNLYGLKKGSKANLERAMAVGKRLGGHIVTGHIDGCGKIVGIKEEDIATWVTIQASPDILKYIILKGSVALDGISLTVAKVEKDSFSISLIPHTKGETTIYRKKIGDEINIECDVIGKYVDRLLFMREENESKKSKITEDFLRKSGFI